jgi:hypothetical protein
MDTSRLVAILLVSFAGSAAVAKAQTAPETRGVVGNVRSGSDYKVDDHRRHPRAGMTTGVATSMAGHSVRGNQTLPERVAPDATENGPATR